MQEDEVLEALAKGVRRTSDLIRQATEYHGGAVRTEYLLTADIAREFIERHFQVRVECLNRSLVNALTRSKGTAPSKLLRSKRIDVAVVESDLIPLAIVEVKIGVSKLTRLKGDLEKISTTLALMQPKFASRAVGALVFQCTRPVKSGIGPSSLEQLPKRRKSGFGRSFAFSPRGELTLFLLCTRSKDPMRESPEERLTG
ncbi:MAG: hypothetical protein EOS63_01450 [Mesorhizobium sp.]|uniref:hypothetical protein n=1 Tax=Mesorhizobium sp. TaxID=1871066 RepID=UPI000FE73036|nr:hypothetical protein [Mesorhizobium sp.]RWE85333.1 MAG: hypothetical protein EOS63_01450 [Mesorhizobium sp.]TJW64673.1 MAG: hypothetical protein E5V97_05775 [Mesorhizobium sp.]